jgi:hypothetical protein
MNRIAERHGKPINTDFCHHGKEMDEVDGRDFVYRMDVARGIDLKAASWPPHSKTQAPYVRQNILPVMLAV